MIFSVVYLAARCLLGCLMVLARREVSKDAELLVLRHENAAPVGPLIETSVVGELAHQLAFTDQPVRLYHYRDRDQYEVDAVFEPQHPAKSSRARSRQPRPCGPRASAVSSGSPAASAIS